MLPKSRQESEPSSDEFAPCCPGGTSKAPTFPMEDPAARASGPPGPSGPPLQARITLDLGKASSPKKPWARKSLEPEKERGVRGDLAIGRCPGGTKGSLTPHEARGPLETCRIGVHTDRRLFRRPRGCPRWACGLSAALNPSLPPVDLLRTRPRPLVRPTTRVPPAGSAAATRGFRTPSPRTSDHRLPALGRPQPGSRASLAPARPLRAENGRVPRDPRRLRCDDPLRMSTRRAADDPSLAGRSRPRHGADRRARRSVDAVPADLAWPDSSRASDDRRTGKELPFFARVRPRIPTGRSGRPSAALDPAPHPFRGRLLPVDPGVSSTPVADVVGVAALCVSPLTLAEAKGLKATRNAQRESARRA